MNRLKRMICGALALFILLSLCACGKALTYGEAREKFLSGEDFTLTCESSMQAKMANGEEDKDINSSVTLTLYNGVYFAKLSSGSIYYYKDGNIYSSTADGDIYYEAEIDEFLSLFDFMRPLPPEYIEGNLSEGDLFFTDSPDFEDKLLAISQNLSWADPSTSEFGAIEYSFKTNSSGFDFYSIDFDVTVYDGGEKYADVHENLKVSFADKVEKFDMPDLSGFAYADMDEVNDRIREEVLYVIFEALYDEDGNKRENYDETYAEFVEMYGEEEMRKIAEVADMFR